MVYAYDLAIQLPVRDIYDTLIMMASINAAKDMYERGQKLMEDFYKNYGDFFSPISSDMDWYNDNVTGAARNFINELYKNGVDPLRSAEGRSLIQQFINNVPVGEINKRKQAAAAAQEYIKARGLLEAKGLWNPDYERYLLGGRSLEDWDTARDGLWTRTAPGEFKDLNAATTGWFNQLEPSYLRTENGYDYIGVSPEAIQKVMTSLIPGFIDSNLGGYHYELARRQLIAQGNENPTAEDIVNRLRNNIQSANSEVLRETRTINPEYKLNLDLEQYRKKAAIDDEYAKKREARAAARAARAAGTSTSGQGGDEVTGHNWDAELYGSVISNLTGGRWHWSEMGPEEFKQAGNMIRSNAQVWANGVNARPLSGDLYKGWFMDHYTIDVDAQSLIGRTKRKAGENANQFIPDSRDINKLISADDMLKNTEGFDNKKISEYTTTDYLRQKIKEAGLDNVRIDVQDSVYGAPMKNATNITPRQIVNVQILDGDGNVVEEIPAGYKIGPDSRGTELVENPNLRENMPGTERVWKPKVKPGSANSELPLNAIPNVYNTPYTNFGNWAVSKKYGDSSQGTKYNGIIN